MPKLRAQPTRYVAVGVEFVCHSGDHKGCPGEREFDSGDAADCPCVCHVDPEVLLDHALNDLTGYLAAGPARAVAVQRAREWLEAVRCNAAHHDRGTACD